jgi:hypothetical protein
MRGFAGAVLICVMGAIPSHAAAIQVAERWSAERANQWYSRQPWLVGANYIPSDSINELEMFQAATFNAALNDKELGMAESIGMNTIRVFLQDQLWEQDSKLVWTRFFPLQPGTTFDRSWCCSIPVGKRTRSLDRSILRSQGYITQVGFKVRASGASWTNE